MSGNGVPTPFFLTEVAHARMLRNVAVEMEDESDTDPVTKERIQNMLAFVENTSDWYEKIVEVPTPTLRKLMKLGTDITKALSKKK